MNLRFAAAQVVCNVLDGASLADALPSAIKQFPDERDQAFLQAVSYGVCRWYFRLAALLDRLLDKPLKSKDRDIYSLMLVGLYQLIDMRVPAHAAVAETVAATQKFKKIWAKGLVNAVLRNYQRHAEEINESIEDEASAYYSHPDWMIEKVADDWPNEWQDILTANNEHPPFTLRVNQKHQTRADYLIKLNQQQMNAVIVPETEAGITLAEAVSVQSLPGFASGDISVQDGAAQLAVELLQVANAHTVLDACAAPGGKTTHILERTPELAKLIALDKDSDRLQLVNENLSRLKLSAEVVCADAGRIEAWWKGELFDRILLDAPCSASGVIRRHPDIKLLREPADIVKLAKEQLHLLTALWPLLKPGGLLVYATCSIFQAENTRVLESFIAKTPDVQEEKINAKWGKECSIGRQILPGMHGMDGFYFACLLKGK
jgi:16S rRNA (cytosine967-C5)-methyltransferase